MAIINPVTDERILTPFERRYTNWKETFIIWPRKINGHYTFLSAVYYRDSWVPALYRSNRKEYTDLFGILKS